MGTTVETKASRSALTEKLLRLARKSLNEISEETGLPVGELSERYADLFEDRGWRTERQEERLNLIELGDFIEGARNELKNAADSLEYAAVARVVLAGMNSMADRFDKRKKLVDDEISMITRSNARLFGTAFDIALSHVTESLKALHPEITDDEILLFTEEGLRRAEKRLEANVNL